MICGVLVALAAIATALLAYRSRPIGFLGAAFAVMTINPAFTLVKGLTALRVAFLAAFLWFLRRPRSVSVPLIAIAPATLALWSAVTALWAPDPAAALTRALEWALVCSALLIPFVSAHRETLARTIALVCSPAVILGAVTTIGFRLLPAWEHEVFRSPLSRLFFGVANVEAILSGELESNVLLGDGMKAGGILSTNANRASLILGIAALAYAALAIHSSRRYAVVVAILAAAAVIATNSKTGIVLLAGGSVVVLLATQLLLPKTRRNLIGIGITLIAALTAGTVVLIRYGGLFFTASEEALKPRTAIWTAAPELISQQPLIGSGAGSWEIFWRPIAERTGFHEAYPPHNVILRDGIDLGLIGVILAWTFIAWMLWKLIALAFTARGSVRVAVPLLALFAWAWVIVHGQGDNTDFFGIPGNVPFLVILLALALDSGPWTARGLRVSTRWPLLAGRTRLSSPSTTDSPHD